MPTFRSDEPRIRVTRTLVYEGPESWVRQTLAKSFIGSDRFEVVHGFIVETARCEEYVPAEELLVIEEAAPVSEQAWKNLAPRPKEQG